MSQAINSSLQEKGFVHLVVISGALAVLVAIGLVSTASIKTTQEFSGKDSNVKGIRYLARGGDDSGSGSSGGGSGSSGSSSGGNSNSGGSGPRDSGNSNFSGGGGNSVPTSTTAGGANVSDNTFVDCMGPDGKHFNSTFKACGDLAKTWHQDSFSFKVNSTPIEKPGFKSQPPIITNANTNSPESASPNSEVKTGTNVKTQNSTDQQRTEVVFGEGEKVKTRVENGKTRIDVYSNGVKVRYEIKDGKVVIKAENEGNDASGSAKLSPQEIFRIEDRLNASGIKIATSGAQLLVARNNVGAVSNFPIQIDLNTNQLIASTSAGIKTFTTLPDQAVQNLLAANIISKLNPSTIAQQANTGGITSVKDIITLSERNGVAVYTISGLKQQNLLGFIPITTPTTVFVSAETGQPVAQEQSLLTNIIKLLSTK